MAKKQTSARDYTIVGENDDAMPDLSGVSVDRIDPNASVPDPDVDVEKRRLQDQLAEELASAPDVPDAPAAAPLPEMPAIPLVGLDPGVAAVLGAIMASQQQMMMAIVERMDRMVQGQSAASKEAADALRRSKQPDNTHAPAISVFNPRGELAFPKPQLKCPMLFPWEADRDAMTREEIELANLLEPGEYTVKRVDGTKVTMTISGSRHPNDPNRYHRLIMNHETGFNNDNFRLMPSFADWLRQILKQRPHTHTAAQKVLTMEEEEALIDAGELEVGKGVI